LSIFNVNQVEYLIVGGYAVAYYGYIRATNDIDISIIDPEHLKLNKKANGRHKDLDDLENI